MRSEQEVIQCTGLHKWGCTALTCAAREMRKVLNMRGHGVARARGRLSREPKQLQSYAVIVTEHLIKLLQGAV